MKIAATAANDSWNPASKTRYGFHARSAIAPSSSAYQASRSLPAIHASEASEPAIPARTTDGCGAHGEHVGGDPRQRAELADPPVHAEQPGEHEHAPCDQDHVLSRDREQVVEPRSAEVLPQVVGERLVVAEDDPFEDRAPLSRETGCDGARQPAAQGVGDSAEAAAPADERPVVDVEDDVDAVPAQPGALVEAVVGPARQPDDGKHLEGGALRRCAARRQLELHPFIERLALEAPDSALDADVVAVRSGRGRHDHDRPSSAVDLRAERAAVERVEAFARPPPAERGEQHARARQPGGRRLAGDDGARGDDRAGEAERMDAGDVRRSQAETECGRERVGRRARPDRDAARRRGRSWCAHVHAHGTTCARRFSMRVGPMPEIASSWSTEVNGPCSRR